MNSVNLSSAIIAALYLLITVVPKQTNANTESTATELDSTLINRKLETPDLVPWILPYHVKEALNQDAHIDHVKISADNSKIALVGSYAWILKPDTGELSKISLPETDPTKAILGVEWLSDNRLLFIEEYGFSEFDLNSRRITQRFTFKSSLQKPLIGYQLSKEFIHFFTGQHLASFTRNLKSLRKQFFESITIPKSAQIASSDDGEHLWWIIDRSLYHSWKTGSHYEKKLVYKSDDPLLQISAHGDLVAITTAKSTLIFTAENKLRQAIPVISQRRIVAANTAEMHHVYLYQDGFLEVLRLPDGQKRSAKLAFDFKKKVTAIAASNDKIILIQGGSMHLWRWQDIKKPIISLQDSQNLARPDTLK